MPIPTDMLRLARRHALLRVAIVLAIATSLVTLSPLDSEAAEDEPTLLGIASGDHGEHPGQFAAEAGRPPAMYQLFWSIGDYEWPNAWAGGILSELEAQGVEVPYIEITPAPATNLSAINAGQLDAAIEGMAQSVANWVKGASGRKVIIAPLPEMNLTDATHQGWCCDPASYKAGYARIRQAFLDQGLGKNQVRFVFAPYGVTDSSPLADYYPGDSLVDIIGFAKYNKNNPWQDYHDAFQKHIDGLQTYVSRSKPILVTQTGSVDAGGNRDAWFDDMFTGLKANDQVIGAIYFNRNKDRDYRVLVGGSLDDAFEAGYDQWSGPSEADWLFDGRMDAWVERRSEMFASRFLDTWEHTFEADIEWLADQGITAGCNPPNNNLYCPDDYVTRGAMAAFLVRALDYTNNGSGNLFVDDNGSTFENDIDKLGTAGVTAGCNPPTNNLYCPDDYVTRGAMAAFLHRALGD